MTIAVAAATIDADGHIVEPIDLWDRYLDSRFRDAAKTALQPVDRPTGGTTLLFEGRTLIRNIQATSFVSQMSLTSRGKSLMQGQPGAWDPRLRLKDMDLDGIDVAVLYTSWAHVLASLKNEALAAAMARAYNDWLADYCKAAPDRLYGVALVPLQDVTSAILELRRAVKDLGFKAVMVRPNQHAGKFLHHPSFDPFWAECQELDVAVGFHPFPFPDMPSAFPIVDHDQPGNLSLCAISHLPIDNMLTMMHLVFGGVLDRFPRLRVAFLESNGGWALMWLDRLDKYFVQSGFKERGAFKTRPSDIFSRQCYISFEPGERSLPLLAEAVGIDTIIWASDYPHFDATFPGVVKELKENMARLSPEAQRKILSDNAARLYKLPVRARAKAHG